jgi:hypothetical protein
MGRAGSTRGRDKKCIQTFVGNLNGRDHLGDLGVDGKIVFMSSLKKWYMRLCTGFIWLGIRTSDGML